MWQTLAKELDAEWEPIDEDFVERTLSSNYFRHRNIMLEMMANPGMEVNTRFRYFRYVKEEANGDTEDR